MSKASKGLGEKRTVFSPGPVIDGEPVTRTFQPSYTILGDGTLVAVCQGRFGRDNDPKQVLMSRSHDGGVTWEKARALTAPMTHFAISLYTRQTADGRERLSGLTLVDMYRTKQVYGADAAALGERTGLDLAAIGEQTPMVLCRMDSDDGGQSWTWETLLGDRTPLGHKHDGWTLIMANPIGQVHTIPEGPNRGRLIIGCPVVAVPPGEKVSDDWRDHATSGSGIMVSDDGGETWHVEGMISDYLGNESSAVSINHGKTIFMIRRTTKSSPRRSQPHPLLDHAMQRFAHTSEDCGKTWSEPFTLPICNLTCHGTLRSVRNRLLFSIPLGSMRAPRQWGKHLDERYRGAVYISDDEGKTWRHKIVEPGSFSYSTIGALSSDTCLVMYATGPMGQEGIKCRVLSDEWLQA